MNKEKFKCIDGATLKIIAVVSMVLDHVNKAILIPRLDSNFSMVVSDTFAILGRFAFPIFCFMIVEGFYHTRNRKRYLASLFLFGCISEIPFNMFTSAEFINLSFQNILFTFTLALATIWLVDILKSKTKLWFIPSIIIIALASFAGEYLALDYGYNGILVPVVLYLFYQKRFLSTLLGWVAIIKEYWTLPSFLLLNLYNGKRGRQLKWLFYIIYPAHLLLLGIIRMKTGI